MPIQTLLNYLDNRKEKAVDDAIKRLRSRESEMAHLTSQQLRPLFIDILDAMANALTTCELDRRHSSLQPFAKQLLQLQSGLSPLLEQMLALRLCFREDMIRWYGQEHDKLPEAVELVEHFFDNFLLAGARAYERESKRQIKEADLRHSSFFENMVFPAFLADAHGMLLRVNSEMSMFLNDKTGEPPRNRHISDLLRDIGVEEEQVGAYMTQLESERKVRRLPLRVKKEHRERLFLEISSAFRYNSDGKAVGIQGFLQDVTEKRISDMRILEQRWLLQAIFDNAPIGLMGIDEQGVLNNLNCMFLRNLDISGEKGETIRQEVTGMPAAKGLDRIFEACPCTSQVITALKEACVAHAESKRFEVVTATGKKALFLTAPLRRSPDGPNGLIVLSQDVTHERQLEKLRDDLTHMIVHDLKNPLSAIQGANATLKLLLADNLNASTEKALAVIGKSVGNMTRMVSNLLDISRLEQNRLPLNLEETDPAELIQEMRSELQSLADHRETRLPQKAVGRKIHLDRELIRRVIQNLFYNAVKHTDGNGRVQIRVVKKEDGGVSISVIDNGEGIPPESREHIFEKFSQVQTRQRGRKTDTGLGLTFCKLAVEAHGGHIALKSEVDKGTTFIVSLPDQPPDGNA